MDAENAFEGQKVVANSTMPQALVKEGACGTILGINGLKRLRVAFGDRVLHIPAAWVSPAELEIPIFTLTPAVLRDLGIDPGTVDLPRLAHELQQNDGLRETFADYVRITIGEMAHEQQ